MAAATTSTSSGGWFAAINGRHHKAAVNIFMVIVLAHWAEHLVQAYQIWVLGWPRAQARGVFGQPFPWLVTSEWLHYGYALLMIIGLFMLLPGFKGRAWTWWLVALVIQFWHHIEHLLLLLQAQTHTMYFGKSVPTSVLQLIYPRVELHLFYNTVVFIPMIIAVYFHLRPNKREQQIMDCSCVPQAKERVLETTSV